MSAVNITSGELKPQEVEMIFRLAVDAQTTSFMAVTFFALLVFDYFITLDKEVAVIWSNRRPSMARYIYIINRYFSLLVLGVCASVYLKHANDDDLCQLYARLRYASSTIIIATVDFILMLRVWVLFGKSRKLLFFIVPWILIEIAAMILVGELTVQRDSTYLHYDFIGGCYSLDGLPPYFSLFALPSLVLGFSMFCLTVWNCHAKLEISFSQILDHDVKRSWMPIATLFFRDGVYWFVAVVAVNPVQMLLWQVAPITLSQVLMVPSMVVYSIIGSRVLLNMMDLLNAEVVSVPRYSGGDF
ncbi:hypothetical protein DFH08DRAFT_840737 [Mycena albidolilacea]|uniref:DUF6533 domain-containing protein n=1 Tax=Mycena albidolilacea TaxID=1033008 RepID=A0AAD7F1V2_9AGAR|nr:hypothetical protein DFH08DRAFT_840737 [Mycena albidolilacea]